MEVLRIPMEQLCPLLEEQLEHGAARLPVTGSSMLPMLKQGRDVVRLVRLRGIPVSGDVLLYRRENGQYVLHRLIRMEGDENCLFCGDNQWEGEIVPLSGVIARVDGVWRGGRWINLERKGSYLCYQRIWTALFPVRRPILGVRRLLGLLCRCINHNGGKP